MLNKLRDLKRALLCHAVHFVYVESYFLSKLVKLSLESINALFLQTNCRFQIISHSRFNLLNLTLDLFIELGQFASDDLVNLICPQFSAVIFARLGSRSLIQYCLRQSLCFMQALNFRRERLELRHGVANPVAKLSALLLPILRELLLQLAYFLDSLNLLLLLAPGLLEAADPLFCVFDRHLLLLVQAHSVQLSLVVNLLLLL